MNHRQLHGIQTDYISLEIEKKICTNMCDIWHTQTIMNIERIDSV